MAAGVGLRSGFGNTARLRCPCASTARTPKTTLSFERGSVRVVAVPAFSAATQSGDVVGRHTTSYPAARGTASHIKVVSFSSRRVSIRTFLGAEGAEARDANVAALARATFAT